MQIPVHIMMMNCLERKNPEFSWNFVCQWYKLNCFCQIRIIIRKSSPVIKHDGYGLCGCVQILFKHISPSRNICTIINEIPIFTLLEPLMVAHQFYKIWFQVHVRYCVFSVIIYNIIVYLASCLIDFVS